MYEGLLQLVNCCAAVIDPIWYLSLGLSEVEGGEETKSETRSSWTRDFSPAVTLNSLLGKCPEMFGWDPNQAQVNLVCFNGSRLID